MITLKQDSELMTNLVSANPVPAGNRFIAIHNKHSKPACFSLSDDLKLNLVIEHEETASLIDFGKHIGIDHDVQAFDVQQGSDLSLNISIAVKETGGKSTFWLVHQVKPKDLLEKVPQSKIIKASGLPEVHHIFTSNFQADSESEMPLIFTAFQPIDRITKEEQLGYLNITTSSDGTHSVNVDKSWALSTNPDKILDIAFGTCSLGDGVFVLYDAAGTNKVQYKVFRGEGKDFSVEPKIPTGVHCINTFIDPDTDYSVLITGGDKLCTLTSSQYTSSKKSWTAIIDAASSMSIRDIQIGQSSDDLSVWFTTASLSLSYYATKVSALSSGTLVPLLQEGKASRVSCMLSKNKAAHGGTTMVNSILSVDNNGNLTLLRKDSQSNLWQEYPFYHASETNMVEVKGYTLRLKATVTGDPIIKDSAKIPYCWLNLHSSENMRCLINGFEAELSRTGRWFRADMEGVLNVLFTTSDLSCTKVFVDRFCPGTSSTPTPADEVVLNSPPLDPIAKVANKLRSIKSGADLLAAKTLSGKPLLNSVTKDEADAAAAAIADLVQHMGTVEIRDKAYFAKHLNLVAGGFHHNKALFGLSWDDICDGAAQAWKWVKEKAHEVVTWGCKIIKDVVHMAITVGKTIYNFVLNTASTIAEGLSWVFKKIGVAIDTIIDFAGFIFNWDDILKTSDNMVALMDAGLEYADIQLNKLGNTIKTEVNNLKEKVQSTFNELEGTLHLTDVAKNDPTSHKDEKSTEDSVAFNWVTYQLQHGGATNAVIRTPDSETDTDKKLTEDIWKDLINELQDVKDFAWDFPSEILHLVTATSWAEAVPTLNRMARHATEVALSTLTNVSDIFLKIFRLGIRQIKALGNYEIECPIFSNLWKIITKGRPLTLFNFCSLVAAIPTTILIKVVSGKRPVALKGRLTGKTLGQVLEKGSVEGDSSLPDDIKAFTAPCLISCVFISSRVTAISLVLDGAGSAGGTGGIKGISGGGFHFARAISTKAARMPAAHSLKKNVGFANLKENLFDTIALVFESVGLWAGWPPKEMRHPDEMETLDILRWATWIMDLINCGAIVITRAVGIAAELDRINVTKQWRGVITGFTCVPHFVCEVIIAFEDRTYKSQSGPTFGRHIMEAQLGLLSDVGFVVAAFTDKAKNAGPYFWIAFITYLGSISFRSALKVLDYLEEHHHIEIM